jgi:heat shock protein HslJ
MQVPRQHLPRPRLRWAIVPHLRHDVPDASPTHYRRIAGDVARTMVTPALRKVRSVMTRQTFTFAALMVAVASVGSLACSSSGSLAGSGTATLTPERVGGAWTLLTLQPPGQPVVGPPTGANFSMEIAGGRVAVQADCNRCSGNAIVRATALTVGPVLACTRALCSSAPFDDTFLQVLSGESLASIEGDVLTLRGERGVLRFRQ